MSKKLIVNADDFGQSDGINKGIILAHEKGIVTSASLMVRYPRAIDAARYATDNPSLGIGLHIDLGEWIFKNDQWEALYEVVSLDDYEDIKVEIEKQLETFYKIMNKAPTHIDSHQHVHLKQRVLPIVIEIAQSANVHLRNYSPNVKYCGKFYGQLDDGSPFHYGTSIKRLQEIILEFDDGLYELSCHPGVGDDVKSMYVLEREREVNTLCDLAIKECITRADIELCSFDGIGFS